MNKAARNFLPPRGIPSRSKPRRAPDGLSDLSTSDLDLDAQEPIRIPGSIQPHGMLVVIDPNSRRIVQASANATALLGTRGSTVLGHQTAQGTILDFEQPPADEGEMLELAARQAEKR